MGNCTRALLPCLPLDSKPQKADAAVNTSGITEHSGVVEDIDSLGQEIQRPRAVAAPATSSSSMHHLPPLSCTTPAQGRQAASSRQQAAGSGQRATASSQQPARSAFQAKALDYSRWDQIRDSDSDEDRPAENAAAIAAIVSGFTGRDAARINGNYTMILSYLNHGHRIFIRMTSPGSPDENICIYFWDLRDGLHYSGWWIGPGVGSDNVFAFNPGPALEPPFNGWREPWFNDPSPTGRVDVLESSIPRAVSSEPVVPLTAVEPIMAPVVKNFTGILSAWRCVECLDILKSPVILCCGHPVCLRHVQEEKNFSCPWTFTCAAKRCPTEVLSQSQPAGVYEHLLKVIAKELDGHPPLALNNDDTTDASERAVKMARTPLQLVQAYETFASAREELGDAASAAAAYLACICLLKEVGCSKFVDYDVAQNASAEDMFDTSEMRAIQVYKFLKVKSAVWSKRCGSSENIEKALGRLPTPHLFQPKFQFQDIVEKLQAACEDDVSLQALVECPVCYGMLFEPVTTPCGHTFCHDCLARSLDFGGHCPLCRGALAGHIQNYTVCAPLRDLLAATWPEAYSAKKSEVAEQQREHCKETWLPIISPLLVFPSHPANMHVTHPEHRLIIRRTLSLGLRRFGACMRNAETGALADYGTEMVVNNFHLLSDGTSLLGTVGCRRFRIKRAVYQEGHTRAEVEYLSDTDEPGSEQNIREMLERLCSAAEAQQPALRQGLQMLRHWMSEASCDECVWAMLSMLPITPQDKCIFLAMPSKQQRLLAMTEVLRQIAEYNASRTQGDSGVGASEAESGPS